MPFWPLRFFLVGYALSGPLSVFLAARDRLRLSASYRPLHDPLVTYHPSVSMFGALDCAAPYVVDAVLAIRHPSGPSTPISRSATSWPLVSHFAAKRPLGKPVPFWQIMGVTRSVGQSKTWVRLNFINSLFESFKSIELMTQVSFPGIESN